MSLKMKAQNPLVLKGIFSIFIIDYKSFYFNLPLVSKVHPI